MKKVEKRLTKAKIELMRQQPFFGRLCLLFDFRESQMIPTMGTDGDHLYYNLKFVKSLSDEHLLAVLTHETIHAALGHIWRKGKRESCRWNLAADYSTNLIVEDNNMELPSGCLLDHKYVNDNSEMIYDKLPKTKKICIYCMMGKGSGEGKEKDGKGKKSKQKDNGKGEKGGKGKGKKENKKKGKGTGKDFKKMSVKERACASHAKWGKVSKKQAKQLKRIWEGAVIDAAKQKGDIPAGFARLVEELTPRENWKEILASYLSSSMTDFNFLKRDRRTLDWPFYFPDLDEESKLENIVVAIDTSGSIGREELNGFVSEVKSMLKFFPKLKGWLIDCDCDIGKVIDIQEASIKKNYYGGGGTSHVPIFKKIEKEGWNPKVVICFTDLYTEFPRKKPPYPVLWLLTPDGDTNKPPFGRVIKLKGSIND